MINRDIFYILENYTRLRWLKIIDYDMYIYDMRLSRIYELHKDYKLIYIGKYGYRMRHYKSDSIQYIIYKYNTKYAILKMMRHYNKKWYYAITNNIKKYDVDKYIYTYLYDMNGELLLKFPFCNDIEVDISRYINEDIIIYTYNQIIRLMIDIKTHTISMVDISNDIIYDNLLAYYSSDSDNLIYIVHDNRVYILPGLYNYGAFIELK